MPLWFCVNLFYKETSILKYETFQKWLEKSGHEVLMTPVIDAVEALKVFEETAWLPAFTYETGIDEPLHPDFMVAARFIEVAMSDCKAGCKIYADPRSNVKVLGHAKVYGCDVTSDSINVLSNVNLLDVRDCESV